MSTEEKTGSIIEQVKETVTTVTERVIDIKENLFNDEVVAEYKLMGTDAAQKIITQLNDSTAIISKSGYELSNIEIDIAVPPSVIIIFQFSRDIDPKEEETLLAEAKDKKILSLVLKALFKANELYNSVKVGNYKLDSVEIGIGFIPDVKIVLTST